jgi:eukaryotic-like serine/threonine-protein kinase
MTINIPKWIGPFKIVKLLGSGCTGNVFMGEDPSLGREVAIKMLKSKFKYDKELRDRFLREARAMASLSHPTVVSVFAVGDEEGLPYMVMEYLSGLDLLTQIENDGAMDLQLAIPIFIDVAQGLKAAAEKKIIHRDVKPANIFLAEKTEAKIGDFGLARALEMDADLTADGVIIGTPDYLSPEIIAGEKANAKSDIYSLACSFYHVVTGAPPFRTNNEDISAGEVLARQLKNDPPHLKIQGSRAIKKIIHKMMNKDPKLRPGYEKIISTLDGSIKRDTLTINIPRLSTIAHLSSLTEKPEPEDGELLLDFPPILLILMAVFFSAAIITMGIFLLG